MIVLGYRFSTRQLIIITIFVTIMIGAPSLLYPFGRDQGIHAYVGAAVLDGELPYRDVFVQKGPFGFFIHTFVTALLGRTTWGIRLFDLIWQSVGYVLLFHIARKRLTAPASLLVVLFTAVGYHAAGFWHTAHHEGFLTPLLLFAIWSYERGMAKSNQHWVWPVLSGTAVAATFWFKQTAAVYTIAFLIWVIIDSIKGKNYRILWWYVVGIGLLHLSMGILLVGNKMLLPMLEIYDYSFFIYPSLTPSMSALRTARLFFRWWNEYALITYPACLGLILILFDQKHRRKWLGLQIIMICQHCWGLSGQGKFWYYHWMSTLPFLALFTGLFYEKLTVRYPRPMIKIAIFIICLLLGRPLFNLSSQNWQFAFDKVTEREMELSYWQMLSTDIPSTIRDLTAEDDKIFVWGHYSILYYFSDRQNPTNFPMDIPLIVEGRFQERWQAEAISEIKKKPPQLILIATIDTNPLEIETSIEQLKYFKAFDEFLEEQYLFDFHMAEFQVFSQKTILNSTMATEFGTGIFLKDVLLRHARIEPDGEIIVSLHWVANQPLDKNYTVFVQVIDFSKPEVIAQNDSQPAWGRSPTSQWIPGESILDTHIITLPAALRAGSYELIVGLYDAETGERLINHSQAIDYYSALPLVVE